MLTALADKLPTERVTYVDHHVLDVDETGSRDDACARAVALALAWSHEAIELRRRGIAVSTVWAIIDDDWLAEPEVGAGDAATPPHVWVSIALTEAELYAQTTARLRRVAWDEATAIPACVERVGRLWRTTTRTEHELPESWYIEIVRP